MIIINSKVYNKLARALISHRENEAKRGYLNHRYPWLFLVGSSTPDSIIDMAYKVRENTDKNVKGEDRKIEQCYRMSNLSAKEFGRNALKIMRQGYIVRGLVRVGDFERAPLHHDDGNVESELYHMNPKMLFITIQPTGITVRQKYKNEDWKIIK